MKMFLLRYSAAALCFVFALGAVSGKEVKAVGDEVSFTPASPITKGASIIWKHISTSGAVTKAIEYDEDGVNIWNNNFLGITSLDEKTGKITIKNLTFFHTGVYTIDINSKEQTQRFSLTVKERVPKPTITIEKSADSKAAYLTCKYDESVTMELSIIWKNSTGEIKTLTSNERSQSITVHSTGNPKNYYTCTLDNIASRATSDPVTEEQLFEEESSSGPWWIIFPFLILGGIGACFGLYCKNGSVKKFVDEHVPCKKDQGKKDGESAGNDPASSTPLKNQTQANSTLQGNQTQGENNAGGAEDGYVNISELKNHTQGENNAGGGENDHANSTLQGNQTQGKNNFGGAEDGYDTTIVLENQSQDGDKDDDPQGIKDLYDKLESLKDD
ncbi:uncharacterized protein si:ch211-132g1.3 isoform X3 [Danio rerio]|uniref:Uncharacterized protein si:ch211-132g1.3 isoform X3 n=1 Tax=Danio rerio TaxID=7955 RepID=A0A8M9QDC4_DANRE|nr:uncharacterized protein si:ch211-132g1.3 isoform X1 [Danio rerio]|eukprot:XP_021331600.1 uncharacterized protein si:ch211-132g1.3 isoform X1 [Danio rerio]